MSENPLKNKKCYLSAPIQHCNRENWRPAVCQRLTEEFGIDVFDPFSDSKQQWVPTLKKAQENRDYDTIVKISKSFVRKDLCMVDRADFLIAFVPYKVCTTGCVHEIINSNNAKKPTLLVTDSPDISYISLWYFGFIPKEFMFAGWDSLYNYLKEVDEGKHKENNRWSYIYGDI